MIEATGTKKIVIHRDEIENFVIQLVKKRYGMDVTAEDMQFNLSDVMSVPDAQLFFRNSFSQFKKGVTVEIVESLPVLDDEDVFAEMNVVDVESEAEKAMSAARHALTCLRLEVHESIANDVSFKVEEAFSSLVNRLVHKEGH